MLRVSVNPDLTTAVSYILEERQSLVTMQLTTLAVLFASLSAVLAVCTHSAH
jgi:hypothetical protein